VPAAERVRNVLDLGEGAPQRIRQISAVGRTAGRRPGGICIGIGQRPATDELDLDQSQPTAAQQRPHLDRVGPRLPRPCEILDVQPDSGETGSRRGLAALGEGVPRRLTESRAGQREEAGDQIR